MARPKRTYRTPIVITLAALAPACGAKVSPDDADGSGGASDGQSSGGASSGGTSSGGASSGGASSGGASTGGAPTEYPECPEGDGYGFTVPCAPTERCQVQMDCTSGENRTFVFECAASGESWTFQSEDCPHPAEFCSRGSWDEATTCEDDGWMYQGQGGNPPGPCPEALPEEGSECQAGASFGGDRTACGYPCGDGDWTVTGCFPAATDPEYPYGEGTWQSDGVCSAGGAGGAEP